MRYQPKHIAEYAALRCIGAVLGSLPYRAALVVGWALALCLWLAMPRRRRETRRRIRVALGEEACTEARARQVAWTAWRNLVFSGIDTLRLPHLTEAWVRAAVDYRQVEVLRDQLKQSGRAILAVPHMGSWELAGLAMHFFGLRMVYIVRHQRNPLTDAYLNRLRALRGCDCIDRESKTLLRNVLRYIREGKLLTILPDVRARDAALNVRFLGGNAAVMKGMAVFAKMSEAPILPACVLREGWTRHRWQAFAPVWPDPALDRDADVQRMTQQVFDIFDRVVREHPEHYFWFNKRWVLDPLPLKTPVPTGSASEPTD
jgi:KDO2-lipid IV(A) lauroyltransferase